MPADAAKFVDQETIHGILCEDGGLLICTDQEVIEHAKSYPRGACVVQAVDVENNTIYFMSVPNASR